jgi:hypothetical protein
LCISQKFFRTWVLSWKSFADSFEYRLKRCY